MTVKLTGEAAKEFMKRTFEKHEAERKAVLEKARAEAERRGKPPFDIVKLRQVAPGIDILRWNDASLTLQFELDYYRHPDAMTLEEYGPIAIHTACILYEG
ncbi:MAG: hypothetical protein AB7O24_08780 [Kofleriaceae bacterium]